MVILDVREKEEFEALHVPHSLLCPLSQFDLMAPGVLRTIGQAPVVVMCRSGSRSIIALSELKKLGADMGQFSVYEGGLQQWVKEGKETRGKGSVFPIMRQVQIVASTMIFLAFIFSHLIDPGFIYLALMVGFGLALSGYTGFCPMVFILQKMPWNKLKLSDPAEAGESCCG